MNKELSDRRLAHLLGRINRPKFNRLKGGYFLFFTKKVNDK